METLQRKIPQNPIKIRADCKLTCTTSDGIDVIKEALLTAKHALNDEKNKIEFKMHASPIYRVEITTLSRVQGEENVRRTHFQNDSIPLLLLLLSPLPMPAL